MSTAFPATIRLGAMALAFAAWGCSAEEASTGPSAEPAPAVASLATYLVRDLGTLGGPFSSAHAINSVG
jgi:hypothetical protein